MSRFAVHRATPRTGADTPVTTTASKTTRATDAEIRQWVEDNRDAFAAYDAYIDANGLFGDGKRLF